MTKKNEPESLECDGNAPYYLFVPGNHDLARSEDVDNSTHKIIKNTWLTDEKLRDTLIWDKTKEYIYRKQG